MASTAGGGSRWALLLAVLTAALGVSLAWNLSDPMNPEFAGLVRVVADAAGAVTLGLAALPRLEGTATRRFVPAQDLWRPIAAAGAVWAIAESGLLLFGAGEASGRGARGISMADFGTFLLDTSAGQVGATAVACALGIVGYAGTAFRRDAEWPTDAVLAVAALALVLRPVTGHMSQQTLGPALGAVHALAAAVWLGVLVALALVVRTRGAWAELLPRYSDWALRCVVVLLATGVINAYVRLGSLSAFVDTGYGRIVVAKAVALGALVALGWHWRRTWVPDAGGHRLQAAASLQRAIIETMLMAIAFGLAAALAVTP